MLVAGLPAIAPARIFPGVLSLLVRSCHGVTSPKVIPLADGHSIFKVLCLLTKLILRKKQALSRISKTMENGLKPAYFHAYGIHGIMVEKGRIFLTRGGIWMQTKLSIPERLKDLRVVDKHLTLEQLAEQTGLSKSALSKYESDDYKDISPFAIATLAEFYGVSTDYLMGLSENKNHPNTELQALHLSDDMVALLSSGKINNRLLCEIATHENFQRLMTDIEIFVDRIADMRIAQMNLVLEATRQEVIRSHAPRENDLYVRTLELGQVQESDFFSHTIHDDLDSIIQDIRKTHVTDRTTADPQPTFTEVKEKFDRAMRLGSNEERVIHEFCDQMQIPFDKIASEDFSAFMRILSLSKLLKNPNNMRGKARPQKYHSTKNRKKRSN